MKQLPIIRFKKITNGFMVVAPSGPGGQWEAEAFLNSEIDQIERAKNYVDSIYQAVAERVLDDAKTRIEQIDSGQGNPYN